MRRDMTDAPTAARIAPEPKPWVMAIAPYVPGRATSGDGRKIIKLSANENPLGTPAAAQAALEQARTSLDRYPDPGATILRDAVARRYGLDGDRVIYGSGSDDVLHLAAGAFAGPGDEVIYVNYGFAVYEIATRRVGATPVVAPDKDYATNVDAILACVTDRTRIVFVANPNNPTGTYTPRAELERLHAALPPTVLLVVDQAYAEYLTADEDDGAMALAMHAPNVLVTRTFSKIYGLAAERVGWGYGAAPLIEAMHRIRLPFNVTTAGQHAAVAAMADTDFVETTRAHNRQWRAWFADQVASMGNFGLRAIPSKANFVLVLFEGEVSAETAYQALMDGGYAVRWLPNQGLAHGLRITIGAEADMRTIVTILRQTVEARD